MRKISEIQLAIRNRDGYPALMDFADILVDGRSLYEIYALEYDYVSCLGWGSQDFQNEQISKLLLQAETYISNRYSLFICPACADLGCGSISLNIEGSECYIKWFNFGYQNSLNYQVEMSKRQFTFYFDKKDYFEKIKSSYGICGFKFPWN